MKGFDTWIGKYQREMVSEYGFGINEAYIC